MRKNSSTFGSITIYLTLLAVGLGGIGSTLARASKKPQANEKLKVVFFLSTDCPVAMKYTPRINRLVEEFQPKGVAFTSYFPNDLETQQGISSYCRDRKYTFPAEIDLGGAVAKKMDVKMVPTVVVLDNKGKSVYHGAIDNNKDGSLANEFWLADALNAALSGKPISKAKTEPFGCVLMAGEEVPSGQKVTYSEHVKPILDKACVKCHRPGEVAPFSLMGYENAKKWAPMIEIVTHSRKMPPWKAVQGYGDFESDQSLSEREIAILKNWNDAGSPRGDAKKEPSDPAKPGDWPLGKPDLILQPAEPYHIAAEGRDDYRHFIIKTDFKETKYIKSMAVKPGNPRIVHHVIAFLDESGRSHRLDGRDGKPGYSTFGGAGFLPSGSLGGWAPGLEAPMAPDGIAFELKPGTTVVLQVHYHRNGKDETDQTKIGLYFAKEKIEKTMGLAWLANVMLNIPAGQKAHASKMTVPIPADVTVYSLMPHMHLLGRSMRADVEYPDGRREPLIYVDDWDFNWQLQYSYKVPKRIPRGSKIHIEAIYDNSAENPNNPSNPPKPVRWGEETTDEMMLLVAAYTVDAGRSPARGFGFSGPRRQPASQLFLDLIEQFKGN